VTANRNGVEVNTFTDENGNYTIQGLAPGTYDLTFTPNERYNPGSRTRITVEEDKVTTVPAVTLTLK
jgi:protocatechuate 3,4-dioxygenase beta subunit